MPVFPYLPFLKLDKKCLRNQQLMVLFLIESYQNCRCKLFTFNQQSLKQKSAHHTESAENDSRN